ncbi:MAG: PAS domain S-box protein [Caldithrix sp.]|nr:PAS domain S-box protein [Caldithrix sp.]
MSKVKTFKYSVPVLLILTLNGFALYYIDNTKYMYSVTGLNGLLLLALLWGIFKKNQQITKDKIHINNGLRRISHSLESIAVNTPNSVHTSRITDALNTLSGLLERPIDKYSHLKNDPAHQQDLLTKEEAKRLKRDRIFDRFWALSVDGMRVVNAQGIIDSVNDAYCRMVGLPRDKLIGQPFTCVYETSSREHVMQTFLQEVRTRVLRHHHDVSRTLWNGKQIWLEFANTVLELNSSQPLVLSVIKDISKRKAAQSALAESEERYRVLFNSANDSVFVHHIGDNGKFGPFVEVNEEATRQLVYSKDELLQLNPYLITPLSMRQTLDDLLVELNNNKHAIYELQLLTKDKRPIPAEINSHLFFFRGQPTVLSIARNITERKRAEEQLKKSSAQLRKLTSRIQSVREEERTLIAREIHDELGQVLTVLKIQLSLMNNQLRDDQRALKQQVKGLSQWIDETVEVVQRITTKLRPGILDELGLIPALEWQAQDFQKNTGITCTFSGPQDSITFNREKATAVFRIFQESLTNVARHANASRVSVFVRQSDNRFTLEITDNGVGISDSQLNNPNALGILGMRERALLFDGAVHIEGIKHSGTHVMLIMPFDQ